MIIKEMLSQNRRDFKAIFTCESCSNDVIKNGYDDRNFHDNVIPNVKCEKCGLSSNDLGIIHKTTPTKYSDWEVV